MPTLFLCGTPGTVETIAASLYLPNYLSFESALSRYGILNLIPYTVTFATTRKTKRFTIEGRDVEFRQLKKDIFRGYDEESIKKVPGIYAEIPEKDYFELSEKIGHMKFWL